MYSEAELYGTGFQQSWKTGYLTSFPSRCASRTRSDAQKGPFFYERMSFCVAPALSKGALLPLTLFGPILLAYKKLMSAHVPSPHSWANCMCVCGGGYVLMI